MPEVRQLMAEGVDQTRVLERLPRRHVAQPDLDGSVGIADSVTALDVGSFRLENVIAQAKLGADSVCVCPQSADQLATSSSIHRGQCPTDEKNVKGNARLFASP